MLEDELPAERMATLVRDGLNKNRTIFWKVNELILQDHPKFPGLIDLASCTIHTVHNAFGKGMEKFGKEIDQLCVLLDARWEDFKELQKEMDLEVHNF